MKNSKAGKLIAIMLASAGMIISASVNAEQVTLSFADHAPTTEYLSTQGSVYFMKRATELSKGTIKWRYYPAEQMAKASHMLGAVNSGRVDAALLITQYASDQLPLNGVGALPGFVKNTTDSSAAYWSLVKENTPLRKEFLNAGVVPVGVFLLPPYQMFMIKSGEIKKVSDFKGLRIRTSGGSQNISISELGAEPVQIPSPDLYVSLQRGTADGAIFSYLSARGYKLNEIVKSASTNGNFASVPMAIIINKDTMKNLSPELRKDLRQAGVDTIRHITGYMDKEEKIVAEKFKADGVNTYSFSSQTLKSINNAMSPSIEAWVDQLSKRGLPAKEVVSEFRSAVAKIKKEKKD